MLCQSLSVIFSYNLCIVKLPMKIVEMLLLMYLAKESLCMRDEASGANSSLEQVLQVAITFPRRIILST